MKWTYSKVGIDIDEIRRGHKYIEKALHSTLRKNAFFGIGHYAGLVSIGKNKLLAFHTDGVGTKVLVAKLMSKYDTIGIDCIAMNANDIICLGAKPLAFVNYIALSKYNERVLKEIVKGLEKGAMLANVSIVGGETAILPDLLMKDTLDLSGSIVGIVKKDDVITGERIEKGNMIIGIESSGLHSNGYTLARKVLLSKYGVDDYLDELGRSLGEELLEPTIIYVKPIMKLIRNFDVRGIANITGGAFTKISRIVKKGLGVRIDDMPKPKLIFRIIQREGKIDDREMYRTFNMGIGMCIFVKEEDCEEVISLIERYGLKGYVLGKVVRREGIYVKGIRVA